MGSLPGNGNDADSSHFQSLQELLRAHRSMGETLLAISPKVHQTQLAGWTATEAAKGASFSGAFVEVKDAPRHQGAAANDAADSKSKIGAGYAESKAAATILARKDPGIKARARARKKGSRSSVLRVHLDAGIFPGEAALDPA